MLAMQKEQSILLNLKKIEDEDFAKQIAWLEDKKKTRQRERMEQEAETGRFQYSFEKVKTELENVDKRAYLKTRYVVQYQKIKAARQKVKERTNLKVTGSVM